MLRCVGVGCCWSGARVLDINHMRAQLDRYLIGALADQIIDGSQYYKTTNLSDSQSAPEYYPKNRLFCLTQQTGIDENQQMVEFPVSMDCCWDRLNFHLVVYLGVTTIITLVIHLALFAELYL